MLNLRFTAIAVLFASLAIVVFVYISNQSNVPDSGLTQSGTTENSNFRVIIAPESADFSRNILHAWIVTVQDAANQPIDGATITIKGGMPMHDHGLASLPTPGQGLGDGKYRIDGLRFHMAGLWKLDVTIDTGSLTDTAHFTINFKE